MFKTVVMSRECIEEFCIDYLAGCYSHILPKYYVDRLEVIDVEFTEDNIKSSLTRIFRDVLHHESVNWGRIISTLEFSKILHNRYFWFSIDILVQILADVLEGIAFDPANLLVSIWDDTFSI